MPEHITTPTIIEAAGKPSKVIQGLRRAREHGDRSGEHRQDEVVTGLERAWPAAEVRRIQRVLRGRLRVEHEAGTLDVTAGQAVLARAGEWVRYSTPDGAEYIAVCIPAFSPETVRRDE
jgi:mannose-6-phosphate isomerase-like protein (cupin superfamily)